MQLYSECELRMYLVLRIEFFVLIILNIWSVLFTHTQLNLFYVGKKKING